jgi:hypothetical protein
MSVVKDGACTMWIVKMTRVGDSRKELLERPLKGGVEVIHILA